MVVDTSGLGSGPVVVAGFCCQDRVFGFEFMCMCSSVTFSIIVDKHLWISLELLDQQGGVWVL